MPDPLEAKAKAQAATLDRWQRMASTAVAKAVDAAHAHAVVALTDTLKRTADGRATIRKARQSPSYQAALNRLDELWDALVGPSATSLNGSIRAARSEFYKEATTEWFERLPKEFLRDGIELRRAEDARANDMRRLVLHGMELRTEIGAKIGDAKRNLLASIERAARRSVQGHVATDILETWKATAKSALTRSAVVALSDSQVAIDGIAALDVVRPEFRPVNPFTPD